MNSLTKMLLLIGCVTIVQVSYTYEVTLQNKGSQNVEVEVAFKTSNAITFTVPGGDQTRTETVSECPLKVSVSEGGIKKASYKVGDCGDLNLVFSRGHLKSNN